MTPWQRSVHMPPLWFLIPIVLIIGAFIFLVGSAILSAMRTHARNKQSPLLERQSVIVGRRQRVHGDSARTDYYLTFEFGDGSREEFAVTGEQFGLLVDGDRGLLTSQGTWYKGFQRVRP